MQGLDKNYEDHAGPLIDTYNLVENTQYLYSEKYRPHRRRQKHEGCRMTTQKSRFFFFYCETMISIKIIIICLQPNCMYQLRVRSGPPDFCLGLTLVDIV